jgi:hypothetical protein
MKAIGASMSAPTMPSSARRSEKIEAMAAATIPRGAIHIRKRRSLVLSFEPRQETQTEAGLAINS